MLKKLATRVFNPLRLGRLAVATGLISIALSASPADATYATCPGANLVQSAAKSFADASRTHNPAVFANAISRYSDVNGLALFALGQYRGELPPNRKAEYVAKTRAYIGRFLAAHEGRFANSALQIQSCFGGQIRSVAGRESIVWKLSGNRVSDVEVGGVWLVAELRSKFVSIIRDGHGNIESLFAFLDRNR